MGSNRDEDIETEVALRQTLLDAPTGASPDQRVLPVMRVVDEEQAALYAPEHSLGRDATATTEDELDQGDLGLAASAVTLAKLIVGAGAAALPFAFSQLGIVFSVSFLMVIAIMTHFSINALTLGTLASGAASYSGTVAALLGRSAAASLEGALVLRCAGLMIVYIVIGSDILAGTPALPGVLCEMAELLGVPGHGRGWCDQRGGVAMVLCIVLVAPLIAPSHLAGSTSVTAAVGLAGVGLWALATVLLAVVAHFNGLYGKIPWWPPMHDLSLAAFVTQLLATLPVIATAYTCQMSVHFVMRELEGFGRGRMTLVSAAAVTLCSIIFLAVGFGSGIAFGARLPADILEAFAYENLSALLPPAAARTLGLAVRVAFFLSILANFPLQMLPYRESFGRLLLRRKTRLVPSDPAYYFVTYASLALFYFVAMSATSIWTPLQFVGATAGAFIAFFCPAAIALATLRRRGLLATAPAAASAQASPGYWRFNAWALVVCGTVQAVTGIAAVFLTPPRT